MRRSLPIALVAGFLGLVAAPGLAAPTGRPTVARCLAAWNTSTNARNQHRLVALRARSASLRTGVAGVDSWSKSGGATSTRSQACLLMLEWPTTIRAVTGTWSGRTVSRWRFARPVAAGSMPPPNVRVRRNGRLRRL